ncbi:major histocompatibility complex class I-related gene protein-like [Syngnathus acus]|uniref:major histocompatibility complex class I-related gene protein-like n=1 Tax=Syngnathus acus TaxID=161584 RepID=UPI001885BFB1|nr:major histocompatibility complex class I-related gene protein-like [Syngnathus acus]
MLRMNLLAFFVAAVQIHSVTTRVIHTLNYFMTASRNGTLPEYLVMAYVDGVQILQFDSNHRKTKAKHDWVNKITEDSPHFWEIETAINIMNEQIMKGNIETAKKHFNQTGGVHMIQVMKGCEWDDETGEVDSWEHYRYDGEDFLPFEAKTMTWIAAHPQAFITKLKWDQIDGLNKVKKITHTKKCPVVLKTHLRNGRDFLTRTELPKVFLLQKTPFSPVTCHATGFYPRTSSLFWRKNGKEIHKDVEMGATLPNHDGTFQTSAHLKVEVTPAAEREYECVFRLAGVSEDIVIKLDAGSILSNQALPCEKEQDRKKEVPIYILLVTIYVMAVMSTMVLAVMGPAVRQEKGSWKKPVVNATLCAMILVLGPMVIGCLVWMAVWMAVMMAVVMVVVVMSKAIHLISKLAIYAQAYKEEKQKRKEEEERQLSVGILSEDFLIAPHLEIQTFFFFKSTIIMILSSFC